MGLFSQKLNHRYVLLSLLVLGFVSLNSWAKPCPVILGQISNPRERQTDAEYLHKANPMIHESKIVDEVIKSFDAIRSGGQTTSPIDKLSVFLQYLEKSGETSEGIARVKESYLDAHVMKEKEIPEDYYALQQRIARELGHGNITPTPEEKRELARVAVKDQKDSLSSWIDYLFSREADYPAYIKSWVLSSVAKLGKFNPETGDFEKRTSSTVSPFPELNQEALAKVIERVKADKSPKESFARMYAKELTALSEQQADLTTTEGKWVKYPKGSDAQKLSQALQGKNTGWCTAATETAKSQLAQGDFYVYFSNDKAGIPSQPRLAIRMQGEQIAEVRGIAKSQHLDTEIGQTQILDNKLKEFGSQGAAYKKKSSDMKQLTEIERKHQKKQELSPEDLRFLYEIDHSVEGFGYHKDPRIEEILQGRNFKEDVAKAYGCKPEEVSNNPAEALNGKIKVFVGNLESNIEEGKNIHLPEVITGDLWLPKFVSAEGLVLPKKVGGIMALKSLRVAKGLIFPKSLKQLSLSNLNSVEDCVFPENVEHSLDLQRLTSIKQSPLSKTVGGNVLLNAMTSPNGLVLPERVDGDIFLQGLPSSEGVILPKDFKGKAYFR